MSEIEVNEYVRIKGKIAQVVRLASYKCIAKYCVCFKRGNKLKEYYISDKNIVKHSKDIIDLIEVGDYVNGKYVYSIGTAISNLPIVSHTDGTFTPSNMIKSIVTKEQFAIIEYKV